MPDADPIHRDMASEAGSGILPGSSSNGGGDGPLRASWLSNELDPREVVIGEPIGEGSFGTVFRGTVRNLDVAIKTIHLGDDGENAEEQRRRLDQFRQEIAVCAKYTHPNVVLYLGSTYDSNRLMLIMELLSCDLETLLKRNSYSLVRRLFFARDAALGLSWLHQSDPVLLHRDLKPQNLLVDRNLRIKLADFGLSAIRERGETIHDEFGAVGTPLYAAPEVLLQQDVTEKSDIYSFGVTLWWLVHDQQRPFANLDALSDDSFVDVVATGERPPIAPATPRPVARLIADCWDNEPEERPSAMEMLDGLTDALMQVAVRDPTGRRFWGSRFGPAAEKVAWPEFFEAFRAFMGDAVSAAALDAPPDDLRASLQTDILESVLRCVFVASGPAAAAAYSGDDVDSFVFLEQFGRSLDYFGALGSRFVLNATELLLKPWFFGDCSTKNAERLLIRESPGVFLVRFSSMAGFFTVSRVVDQTTIHHQRITHAPLSEIYAINDQSYGSLIELIDDQSSRLSLKEPCPGSPFADLWVRDRTAGYLSIN